MTTAVGSNLINNLIIWQKDTDDFKIWQIKVFVNLSGSKYGSISYNKLALNINNVQI